MGEEEEGEEKTTEGKNTKSSFRGQDHSVLLSSSSALVFLDSLH